MRKEQISDKEAFCLAFIFISGSTLILGIGAEAQNDAWLAGIVGAIMALPLLLIYSRLLSLFQGKDLFQILECVFGKILGKTVSLIYIWYAFHLGSIVIRNYGAFVNTVALPETPMFFSMLFLVLTSIYVVKSGIEGLARLSTILLPMIIVILVVVQLLAIPSIQPEFLKPFLGNGLAPVIQGGMKTMAFPYAETVVLMGAFYTLKSKKSSYRVYTNALLYTTILIVALTLRNIMLLGTVVSYMYFPSNVAVSLIRVGTFIQRIELTVSIVFIVGVFIKSSLCLLVASRGVARLFGLKDYRSVAAGLGLIMVLLAQFLYKDTMMMRYWAFNVYPYYTMPFQIIFPLIIWITAEIKKKKILPEGNQPSV